MNSELLTPLEVAARARVSLQVLKHRRMRGQEPAHVKVAGRVRYWRVDVEAWLEASTVRPAAPLRSRAATILGA